MKTSQLHEYAATAAAGLPIDAGDFTKSLTLASLLLAQAVTASVASGADAETARLLDSLQSLRAACKPCLTDANAARITGIASEAAAEFLACLNNND